MKKHNFSAGPSILPQEVLEQARNAIKEFDGTGLSILEISHRSKEFVAVMDDARNLALEIAGLKGKGYAALFLAGGASLQFAMIAYNFLKNKAAYVETGKWAENAITEAETIGGTNSVEVIASSKDQNYAYLPAIESIPTGADYLHITSNNTIYGTQYKAFPKADVPIICDMSSDIFSRQMDYSQFDLIYAGVQKNMGPAGAVLVMLKEELLNKINTSIPNILNYKAHASKTDGMYNTPSVYAVYTSLLTMQWIQKTGIDTIEKRNKSKAALIYDEIENNELFIPHVKKAEDRSYMNISFRLSNESLEEDFNKLLQQSGIVNLKGYRSLGGYRASLYNALPIESVEVLVKTMKQLKK